MNRPEIDPRWDVEPSNMAEGYSIEMTAKDCASLRAAAPDIPPGTPIAVAYLPSETDAQRLEALKLVRELGFEPMPHFSARRIRTEAEFESYLSAAVSEAGVRRCFVVAGDPSEAAGPYSDSASLIGTGAFERSGIRVIGIGGHPEGHPNMTEEQCWEVLETKFREIERRGMAPLIVTQFAFDADGLVNWVRTLRARGIDAPLRLGVPGPAGIKTLMRFAARCGVGASTSVLSKYGISIGRLLGSAGPDKLLEQLERGLGDDCKRVRLHFYPFGGLEKTVDWINGYVRAEAAAR